MAYLQMRVSSGSGHLGSALHRNPMICMPGQEIPFSVSWERCSERLDELRPPPEREDAEGYACPAFDAPLEPLALVFGEGCDNGQVPRGQDGACVGGHSAVRRILPVAERRCVAARPAPGARGEHRRVKPGADEGICITSKLTRTEPELHDTLSSFELLSPPALTPNKPRSQFLLTPASTRLSSMRANSRASSS